MSRLKIAGRVVLGLSAVLVVAGGGGYFWAQRTAEATLARVFDTHRVDFPIPFPLGEAEIEALRAERLAAMPAPDAAVTVDPGAPPADPLAGVDLDAIALERAQARGKHLVESRYACIECHGDDFGGGTMLDDPAIGTLLGPNLTGGKGGRTSAFTAAEWDRKVRHGVSPEGRPGAMPSGDFVGMTDRELSDVVSYVRAQPPVDRTMAPIKLGPLGTLLLAVGEIRLSADDVPDHHAAHAVEPPDGSDPLALGKHLAQVCTGCHNPRLSGGPMAGGDPSWAEPANLTAAPDGLAGWTRDDFFRALREAKSKDGRALSAPMDAMPKYMTKATDAELDALWTYV
ncbi:MAG: c-type cytochrome [Deltaproteobacteria bacterium]|nr:c-type cytochrome [Deltaproteobacteria bacterium]